MKKLYKIIIIILLIAIISILFFLYNVNKHDEKILFALYGDKEITLYEGNNYNEPGFIVFDKNHNFLNERVKITSDLNTNVVGSYTINYEIKSSRRNYVLTRIINVIEDPLKNISFTLNGGQIINLLIGEEYSDPLYNCVDNETNTLMNNQVTIKNNVNNQAAGSYSIEYTLNINGKVKTITRTVNILEKKYTITLSNNNPTNNDVDISFASQIFNFSYIIDPSGKRVDDKSTIYKVSSNGEYKFNVYDTENNFEEYTVNISNIDKISPTILSCTSYIENNQTHFKVLSNDTDIANYIFNNNSSLSSMQGTYTVNSILENNSVTVYDKAGNYASRNCQSYYKEISPKGNENIIREANSDTLKVWIEKNNRTSRTSYYTSHIWVLNPYEQFKSAVTSSFGNNLEKPTTILNNVLNNNNFNNKIIIAANASGFILKGTYRDDFYQANNKWNKTSGSPIVIVDGKVLRNFSSQTIPKNPYVTYGLKSNGELGYYNYVSGTNVGSNIDASNQLINDGVRYTYAFEPVLVDNYKVASNDTTLNIRQSICQIDKNNFLFVTDVYQSTRNGFSYKELAQYMISKGCKTGFNVDGGGSTTLLFKNKDGDISIIEGNNRNIADIIYFHE